MTVKLESLSTEAIRAGVSHKLYLVIFKTRKNISVSQIPAPRGRPSLNMITKPEFRASRSNLSQNYLITLLLKDEALRYYPLVTFNSERIK